MRVLVTGNLGYIGSVLTPLLNSSGYEVWGLDTGYYQECTFSATNGSYDTVHKQIYKDIRDTSADDLEGVDAVIHLAALSNDPIGELNPILTEDINYRASVRLAQLSRTAHVSRFLFSSSCSMYGASGDNAVTEEAPLRPLTTYARSKAQTESGVAALANKNFSPVFLRNSTAYGISPRLRCDLVVNNLLGNAFTTNEVKLMSDGTAWRPIVHVEDIACAFLATLASPREVIHNQAFNVGQDTENYQVRVIAEMVAKAVPDSKITYAEGASPDNRSYHVSFAKIRMFLPKFQPRWTLQKGIKQLYESLISYGLTSEDFQGRRYTRIKQLQYLLSERRLDPALRWMVASHNRLESNKSGVYI